VDDRKKWEGGEVREGKRGQGNKSSSFLISNDGKKLCKSHLAASPLLKIQMRFTSFVVLTPVNMKLLHYLQGREKNSSILIAGCLKLYVELVEALCHKPEGSGFDSR
jgi:hypothetical protein